MANERSAARAFEPLTEPSEGRDVAETIVALIRGAVELTGDPVPVAVGSVFRVWKEGRIDAYVSALFTARLRIIGHPAKIAARDGEGNLVEPPPTPTAAQQWIAVALDNEDVADLLIFFGRADTWFDLYKTIEMAEKIEEGEHALTAIFPRLKLAKTTANSHRHACRYLRGYVPPTLLSFSEAYEVVRDAVSAVLKART